MVGKDSATPMDEGGRAPATRSAAERALAEAQARRDGTTKRSILAPVEEGGRGGLDPVRYGDWETKGLATDF